MAEEYSGIKFRIILTNETIPADPRLEEIRFWCRLFHEKGLSPPYTGGSYGNLSFRFNPSLNTFIITATRVDLKDKLGDDCFVKVTGCNLYTGLVYATGKRQPSSESMMHFSIYKQRPDVQAIFHGHSQAIIVSGNYFGIPETTKEQPYGTIELVKSVLEVSGKNNFFNIKNHGFVSLGKTMTEAGAYSLERLAKISGET